MKYTKELTLALAPFKTIKLGISEAENFEQCDKELMKELNKHPVIKQLNKADIEKAI